MDASKTIGLRVVTTPDGVTVEAVSDVGVKEIVEHSFDVVVFDRARSLGQLARKEIASHLTAKQRAALIGWLQRN